MIHRAAAAAFASAAVIAVPAMAAETSGAPAFSTELAQAHDARQAQRLLVSQGYTGVSALERVSTGRFVGTAIKDGRTVIVGVNLPKPAPATN
jgi:hypothetical protein